MGKFPVRAENQLAAKIRELDKRLKVVEHAGNDPVSIGPTLSRTTVQSPNYDGISTGWAINADGSASFYNVTTTGSVIITDSGGVFIYSGVPALGNLVGAWAGTDAEDPFGNPISNGLQVGLDGTNQVLALPNVGTAFNITSLLNGVFQAMHQYLTSDASQVIGAILGSILLGSGSTAKMATVMTSPLGSGSGAAILLEAENDGGTDTPVITLGTVTSPDGQTEVFSPILTLSQFALLMYGGTSGQTVVTFSSSTTWTAPAGVTSVKVECWGGGGGGGGGGSTGGGGGGGGGGYAINPAVTVTPLSNYAVVVGAGGAGGSGTGNGSTGIASTFNSTTVVTGEGSGGIANFGVGGSMVGSQTGTTTHTGGGPGGTGASHGGGGGGASSAGQSANGNGGGNAPSSGGAAGGGAAAPTGGGRGGSGGFSNNDGNNGSIPGGGGGGGGYCPGIPVAHVGGNGARGQVRLTYQPAGTAPVILMSVAATAGTDQFGNTYPAGCQFPAQSGSLDTAWHAVTLPTNWTGTARVRLLAVPPNSAEFDFAIAVPASSPGTSFGTFPSSAYYPLVTRPVYPAITGSTAPSGNFRVNINVASTGPTIGGTIPASGTTVAGTFIYPLD